MRHTRGTPPAVIETDAATWIALAIGELEWHAAIHSGRIVASGERTDLTAYLPLDRREGHPVMHIRSLGFRTDLRLLEITGSDIEDRGTHLVIRTPANPTYFWGNFLLLNSSPSRAASAR